MTGRVGSGKSSLLAAITAEMTRLHGQVQYTAYYPHTQSCGCIKIFAYQSLQVFIDNLDDGFGLVTQVTHTLYMQKVPTIKSP